jgi:AcrR family transcriptional regulator
MARPRSFDCDEALDRAMLAFWENGYEQTSTRELTAAMGIAAPSLYAAFGDKRRLFDQAVARYSAQPGNLVVEQLDAPTAREGIAAMLHAAAERYTDAATPRGCFIVSEPSLATFRAASGAAIRERLQRGLDAGELPPDTDVDGLTGFYGVVIGGMSAQARDGATAQQLRAVADAAMAAWPGA